MKKLFFCLVLIFILFGFFTLSSFSQDFNFSKAYADYTFQLSQYQKAHSEYELAKAAYAQSDTLAARSEAQTKTASMLGARDETVRTYLVAIRLRLGEVGGILSTEKDPLFSGLDSEAAWYESHRKEVSSAGSLEDLVRQSGEAKARFENETTNIAYKSLLTISKGKITVRRNDAGGIISALDAKIAEIRQNGDKETVEIERWMLDAHAKLDRSDEKIGEAGGEIAGLDDAKKDKLKIYNESIFSLDESFQFIKEAVTFMKQVVREVKTAD